MSTPTPDPTAAARARRLREVFGDEPGDDRDGREGREARESGGTPSDGGDRSTDDWHLENRPPHHDPR